MSEPISLVSAVAAVVSAIGGTAACVAAFRSAAHAEKSFDYNQNVEKSFALRQLSITAHQVAVEIDRAEWTAQGLKIEYKTLAAFTGNVGGSRPQMFLEEVDKKVQGAEKLRVKVEPFIELNTALLNGPIEEITNREVRVSQLLAEATALREQIEIELREIQAQNAVYRDRVVNGA